MNNRVDSGAFTNSVLFIPAKPFNFIQRARLRSFCQTVRKCQRTQNAVPENIKESSQ